MITKYVFQIRLQMYTCVMFNVGDFFLFRLSTLSLKQKNKNMSKIYIIVFKCLGVTASGNDANFLFLVQVS